MRGIGSPILWSWLAALLLAPTLAVAVTTGDVAIISFASDSPDALAFVVLREIPAATEIRFTDSGWLAAGGFRANEGGIEFTAATTLSPGTVISRQAPFDSGSWSINNSGVGSGSFALSTSGDQILTFTGGASSPAFVCAVNFDSAGYVDATSSNTTGLPAGLSAGTTAVDVGEADNGYYDGPTTGTPADLLVAIANSANWITSDSPLTPPSWSFTVLGDGPVVTGVSLPGAEFALGESVDITVMLSTAPDVGSPVTVELTSGAFSGTESLVISNPNASGAVNVALVHEGVWTAQADATDGGAGSATSDTFSVGDSMTPPTAYAGPDRSVLLDAATVALTLVGAAGDDADGLAGADYEWTPASATGIAGWTNRTGPLTSTTAPATASVTFDAVGTYMLTLTITDADGLTDDDVAVISVMPPESEDEFSPPPGYYSSATGQGSTLKAQLSTIMISGHNQQSYGEFRYTAADYDADPEIPGNILLAYNRASVPDDWDGGATWSREHVWPQSRQPGSASNSSTGNLGDPFALRPVAPSINSQRGNMPFGTYGASGSYGERGSYWFPGEEDKGDVARSNFYSATRYASSLSLVSGVPTGNAMGDLDAILHWHYTDVPDDFERRRNHLIYEDQNNRNAYIDRPEFVWTIWGDGANDSTIFVSATEPPDGASLTSIVYPTVIVGGPVPSSSSVLLKKAGNDPTYYSATALGNATSSINGRFNAFDYGSQQVWIDVGLAVSTASAGAYNDSVVIDNLDVSSEGAGQGAADGNDIIDLSFTVLDHSEASFDSASDVDVRIIDFGDVAAGSSVTPVDFEVYNLASISGYTAKLTLQSVSGTGDVDVLSSNAQAFGDLLPGQHVSFEVTFDTTASPGSYQATYTLDAYDEDLPGAVVGTPLTVEVTGTVLDNTAVPALSTIGMVMMAITSISAGGLILRRRAKRMYG